MELNELLQTSVESRASRVLLVAGAPPAYRICGHYRQADLKPLTASACREFGKQLLPAFEQEQLEACHAVETVISIPTLGRFRINVQQQQGSISILVQPLPANPVTLESLGVAHGFHKLSAARSGLLVVGGPSDSGRGMTIAALISEINQTESRFIVTVESGIETRHQNIQSIIVQQEVGTDCSSMHEGLLQATTRDPDIIVTSELTTGEEFESILRYANSGRLAIIEATCLSASSCLQDLIALVSPGQRRRCRAKLSECLQGVAIQNLVTKASGRGRVLAQELLLSDKTVRELIDRGRLGELRAVLNAKRHSEMQSMKQALENLRAAGLIAPRKELSESTEWLAQLPHLLPAVSQ